MSQATPQLPAPPVTGRAYLESRIAQHDGYLWPVERARMRSPGAIRERMVEDIGRLVADGGEEAVVTLDDLRRLGWPQASAEAQGPSAFAFYKANLSRHRRAHRDGALVAACEAAAIATFTFAALLWAGIGAGAL